jgi:hypothetical protein
MKKLHPSLIGLAQGLGVAAYCAVIAGLFQILKNSAVTAPGILASIFMLVLLVFSVAVTGSIVFGYPAYLALKNQIKEAISILAFTLLYCLAILAIIIVIIFKFL